MAGINPNFGAKVSVNPTQKANQTDASRTTDEGKLRKTNEKEVYKTQFGNIYDLGDNGKPGDFALCYNGKDEYVVLYLDDDGRLQRNLISESEWEKLKNYNGSYYPQG